MLKKKASLTPGTPTAARKAAPEPEHAEVLFEDGFDLVDAFDPDAATNSTYVESETDVQVEPDGDGDMVGESEEGGHEEAAVPGPKKKGRKPKPKPVADPNAPPPHRTAYVLFGMHVRADVVDELSRHLPEGEKAKVAQVNAEIVRRWKALGEQEREPFVVKAQEELAVYKKACANGYVPIKKPRSKKRSPTEDVADIPDAKRSKLVETDYPGPRYLRVRSAGSDDSYEMLHMSAVTDMTTLLEMLATVLRQRNHRVRRLTVEGNLRVRRIADLRVLADGTALEVEFEELH